MQDMQDMPTVAYLNGRRLDSLSKEELIAELMFAWKLIEINREHDARRARESVDRMWKLAGR